MSCDPELAQSVSHTQVVRADQSEIRADNMWGIMKLLLRYDGVMVCDQRMKILILTRDDEDMDTWSY